MGCENKKGKNAVRKSDSPRTVIPRPQPNAHADSHANNDNKHRDSQHAPEHHPPHAPYPPLGRQLALLLPERVVAPVVRGAAGLAVRLADGAVEVVAAGRDRLREGVPSATATAAAAACPQAVRMHRLGRRRVVVPPLVLDVLGLRVRGGQRLGQVAVGHLEACLDDLQAREFVAVDQVPAVVCRRGGVRCCVGVVGAGAVVVGDVAAARRSSLLLWMRLGSHHLGARGPGLDPDLLLVRARVVRVLVAIWIHFVGALMRLFVQFNFTR